MKGRHSEVTFVEDWLLATGLLCQHDASTVSAHHFHFQVVLESSYLSKQEGMEYLHDLACFINILTNIVPEVTRLALHVFNCYIDGLRESKRGGEILLLLDCGFRNFQGEVRCSGLMKTACFQEGMFSHFYVLLFRKGCFVLLCSVSFCS